MGGRAATESVESSLQAYICICVACSSRGASRVPWPASSSARPRIFLCGCRSRPSTCGASSRKFLRQSRRADPAERARLLEDALEGWSGEPYAEVADALWAVPEVARLTELRLATTESYAQTQSVLGRDAVVVRVLERHARDHPGREGAAGLLATALYRTGHQSAALDVLRRTREHLPR